MALVNANIDVNVTDDYRSPWWLTDDNGDKIDISGFTFTGQLFTVETGVNKFDFTIDDSILASDLVILFRLPRAQLSTLTPKTKYHYYFQWLDDDSLKTTFVEGDFNVLKGGS